MPSQQGLYVLGPAGGTLFGGKYAYEESVGEVEVECSADSGTCPRCARALGMLRWLPPHRIRLSKAVYPDFLWGPDADVMISGRLRQVYEEHGLTGLVRIDPPAQIVKVGRKRVEQLEQPPPDYHYVRINHRGADLDDERSGARRPPRLCPGCRGGIDALERVVLREGSWTGDDVFTALGLSGSILVTDRFRRAVEDNKLTNAEFARLEDHHFDFYPSRR